MKRDWFSTKQESLLPPLGETGTLLISSARAAQRQATPETGVVLNAASYAGLALLWSNGDRLEAARLVATMRGPFWEQVIELLARAHHEQVETVWRDAVEEARR